MSEAPKNGGHSTTTLNHLVGPSPLKEWVDSVIEEERLLERLKKITSERATHELALRIAGVPREALQEAWAAAKESTTT